MLSTKQHRIWANSLAAIATLLVAILPVTVSQRIHRSMVVEEKAKMELWVMATEALVGDDDAAANNILLYILSSNSTIPVILTDSADSIVSFNNIAIKENIDSIGYLNELRENYKEKYAPLPIDLGDGGMQYLYYNDSSVLRKLYIFPLIQLPIFIFFLLVMGFSWHLANRYAGNRLWVGLSKETAHQLGTPISSLMAWIELLRDEKIPEEMLEEIEKDVRRLEIISHRFQKFGSYPSRRQRDIREIVEESVSYLRLRVGKSVSIFSVLPSSPVIVATNVELLGWVIENLVKNGVDAMDGRGQIILELTARGHYALLDISDTGKGISRKNRRRLFRAGFTTKSKGWGLGLTLAKRIVNEYHNGKLYLLRSEPGIGSTFRIRLPLVGPYSAE